MCPLYRSGLAREPVSRASQSAFVLRVSGSWARLIARISTRLASALVLCAGGAKGLLSYLRGRRI